MTHPSHETRFLHGIFYDEECMKCGATDGPGDDGLKYPCPAADSKNPIYKTPKKPKVRHRISCPVTILESNGVYKIYAV
jgi:hypothetical protein